MSRVVSNAEFLLLGIARLMLEGSDKWAVSSGLDAFRFSIVEATATVPGKTTSVSPANRTEKFDH